MSGLFGQGRPVRNLRALLLCAACLLVAILAQAPPVGGYPASKASVRGRLHRVSAVLVPIIERDLSRSFEVKGATRVPTIDPIHFLLIQPGSPGTTEEAAPLIGRLAGYLAGHLPQGTTLAGSYINAIDEANQAIARLHPRFAIVTLPYYLEHRAAYDWRPQLATRPGGRTEDHYRLLVSTTNPVTTWQALKGEVAGTLCQTTEAVARLMFQRTPSALPFHCQPTDRLLRAARQVARGELTGVVVTDEQYASLTALPEGKQLRPLVTTPPLPPPLVVSFGPPDETIQAITRILMGMKDDPGAKELLTELRTDGFGPIDPAGLEPLTQQYERLGRNAP